MRRYYQKVIVFSSSFVALLYAMVVFNFRQTPMSPEEKAQRQALFSDTQRQLDQAHEFAQQSHFKEAISILQRLHPSNPHEASVVEILRVRLADQMLERAQNEFKRGNVAKAIKIGSAIPTDVPAGKQFQAVAQDWNRNQSILDLAQKFQDQGKDSIVVSLLQQLDPAIHSGDVAKRIQSQIIAQSSESPDQNTFKLTSSNSPTDSQVTTATPPSPQNEPQSNSEPEDQRQATEHTEPEYSRDTTSDFAAPSHSAYQKRYVEPSEKMADTSIESSRAKSSTKRPLYSGSSDGPTRDFSGFSN